MGEMGIDDVLRYLPHRYPMLLIDRVIECDDKKRIVGLKNLTFNEPFFQGHFPGDPIMPGVLQLEAMAQLGGILINKIRNKERAIAYFLSIDNTKFRKIVRPGDQMRIEIEIQKIRLGICKVHGKVFVDGEISSEGDLKFGGEVK
ncbi:MAG: 3-hydroxyacyl-ACP dehydratase FabZ [Kiritimatiellae bacterium]|nr:3-hydroxyacyl-ACP dehydratase FabZ [Kiritimatiellia bacterium]